MKHTCSICKYYSYAGCEKFYGNRQCPHENGEINCNICKDYSHYAGCTKVDDVKKCPHKKGEE